MSWIAKQLIGKGISHPQVSLCVGMQKVVMLKGLLCPRFRCRSLLGSVFHFHAILPEIPRMFRFQRIKAADAGQVDYRYRPHIRRLLYYFNIVIDEETERICDILILLDVVRGAIEIGPMDWSQENNLLCGIIVFEVSHEPVDVGPGGVSLHDRSPSLKDCHHAIPVHGGLPLVEPFAYRKRRVEIICSYEYENSINILPVLGVQLLRLSEDIVSRMAADAIAVWLDTQYLDQLVPIDVLALQLPLIRYGIPQKRDLRPVPLALNFRLLGPT